jgi:hypothetical protein
MNTPRPFYFVLYKNTGGDPENACTYDNPDSAFDRAHRLIQHNRTHLLDPGHVDAFKDPAAAIAHLTDKPDGHEPAGDYLTGTIIRLKNGGSISVWQKYITLSATQAAPP